MTAGCLRQANPLVRAVLSRLCDVADREVWPRLLHVWRHFVFVRRGSQLEAWIDGVLDNTATASVIAFTHSQPLQIGADGRRLHRVCSARNLSAAPRMRSRRMGSRRSAAAVITPSRGFIESTVRCFRTKRQ
jgi:hypothetical protein